ncbi:MAG: pentapeptide repeat-containing protein [Cyanobacteria bacterium J06621_15]
MFVKTYDLNQSLNFSGQNLQGCSFKKQNLEGANFSGSDIRGANFAGANLTNTDFSNTRAGLNSYWSAVSFFLSLFTGFMIGGAILNSCNLLYSDNHDEKIVGVIVITGFISFLIISLREGFANAFTKIAAAIGIIGVLAAIISIALNESIVGEIAREIATAFCLNIGTLILTNIFLTLMIAISNNNSVISSLFVSIISVILIAFSVKDKVDSVDSNIAQDGWFAISITAGISALTMVLCADISKRALAGDSHHSFIRKIAVALAASGGTSFREANLTAANFTGATLRNTDFIKANLFQTIWYQAEKLELARCENTILDNPAVRDLLVYKNSENNSYKNASLEGAYLVDINLENIDLKNANLSKANLTRANLNKANLTEANLTETNLTEACLQETIFTKAQAIGTDFTQADLTGAYGLGTWNIDGTTKLNGVNCRFVYLDENPEAENSKRPQSGEFVSGEFTKLFQVVVNTVDLIFRNGLDLEALDATLKYVQAKQNTSLKVQRIEDKGDGFIVIKVVVAEEADKSKIHSQLKQSYEEKIRTIEAKHQAELKAKQDKIQKIAKILAEEDFKEYPIQVQADKFVVLIIGEGDFTNGFPVTAQIWINDNSPPITFTSKLPPEPTIPCLYQEWRKLYRSQKWFGRITFDNQDYVTNFSRLDLEKYARDLQESFNDWLNSRPFRLIEKELRAKLIPSEEVPIIIQTQDIQIQRLPWHLWDFFEHYQQTEVALSPTGNRKEKSPNQRNKIRILTILGNSTGIDVKADRLVLENLVNVETAFLVEPTRKKLHENLWDEQGWDILCYSGHSSTQADGNAGTMLLNQTDSLTIKELKNALTKAIENGLQLAIFNSCDGLGLARELGDLYIPQMIVMREPVPDKVAQDFLKYFLNAFSNGKSLYTSVREARERLEGLEDEFPYATWLPVIFQNSAEFAMSWYK